MAIACAARDSAVWARSFAFSEPAVQRLGDRLELADAGLGGFEAGLGVRCGLAGALEVGNAHLSQSEGAAGLGGGEERGPSQISRAALSQHRYQGTPPMADCLCCQLEPAWLPYGYAD